MTDDHCTGADCRPDEEQVRRDDRAHVFHSWSAQALIDPLPIAARAGLVLLGLRRQAVPRLLAASSSTSTSATSTRKLVAAIQEQAARLRTIARPSPTTPAARRPGSSPSSPRATSTRCSSPTAAPRPTRTPCAWPGCTPAATRCSPTYRSYHGATAGAIALTGDPRRWAVGAGHAGRRALLGALPLPLRLPRRDRGAGVRARAAAPARHVMVEGPHTVAAIILETVVGTNGILVPPPATSQGVRDALRRVRHRDDRRRGDGRLRPLRRVVRRRPLGRHARPHHLRQGRQLRLRPARRRHHLRPRSPRPSPSAPYPGGLTYSGHPLACASAVASISIFQEEGIIEHARDARRATSSARSCAELAEKHPSRRRGPRASACSGRSSSSATGRPASRWCRSTPPAPTPRR